MAGAKEALKRAIAETVVPPLRSHGFKGSDPTWVRTNDRGDAAVVNAQLAPWNTRDEVRFYVNLAVVPEPWRAWMAAQVSEPVSKRVKEYDGLWRVRLNPSPGSGGALGWWEVTDERTAQAAADDIVRRLVDEGFPSIEAWLDRARMLDAFRYGTPGEITRAGLEHHDGKALAVLLADCGPSLELETVLASLLARESEVEDWAGQLELLRRWVDERAASSTP